MKLDQNQTEESIALDQTCQLSKEEAEGNTEKINHIPHHVVLNMS